MSLATKHYSDLPICSNCGWAMAGPSDHALHAKACPYAAAGESAKMLADRFPELSSTKFGYGTSQLTFEQDEHLHVRFHCRNDETFQLEEVWLLDDLTVDEAADLVKVITDWRSHCIHERDQREKDDDE